MHIFVKIGGEKLRGEERQNYLSTYLHFALSSSYFLKKIYRSLRSLDYISFSPPIRGHGNIGYTAGTVKSVSLLKVGRKSVEFPSHF